MDKRFNKMIGNTYSWSSQNHTIIEIQPMADDMFIITTSIGEYRVSKSELQNDFSYIPREVAPVDRRIMEIFKTESVQLNNVSEILMDSIKKLQTNKDYVEQAKAIADSAKTLIDIKKTQVDLLRTLKS